MRAAFLGTPTAAIAPLIALMEIADVVLVVTRPDAARGRSKREAPSPVKIAAREFGLDVAQPATHRELTDALQAQQLDLGLVVAYGRILRPDTLASSRIGFVNAHFSLLPLWRGAAPVERSILAGDESTGVSLMLMEEGLDTGPVIAAGETEIAPDDTGGSLTAALSSLAGDLILDHLAPFAHGQRDPAPQLDRLSTHAAMLHKDDARIVPSMPADVVERTVRAFHPRPGAWFRAGGSTFRVQAAHLAAASVPDGAMVVEDRRLLLGASDGALVIDKIQRSGGRPMTGAAFANGHRGESFELEA